MQFDAKTALTYAQAFSFPRRVGSDGEARAAQAIARQLESLAFNVEHQSFTASTAPETVLSLQILLGQLLILGILMLERSQQEGSVLLGLLILALLTCSATIYRLARKIAVASDPYRSRSLAQQCFLTLGSTLSSANIVASIAGPHTGATQPHLILVAHYDSKSQRIPLPVRIAFFAIINLASAVFAILTLLGLVTSIFESVAAITGAIAILAGIPLLLRGMGNASPGAIDNASAVGFMLHLAELLAAQTEITKKLRITILFTGAEELGALWAQAFVSRHRNTLLERQKEGGLYILNFDGLGLDGELRIVGRGRPDSQSPNADLTAMIEGACRESGIILRRTPLPGALLDHMPFTHIGLDAVSLIAVGKANLSVHTRKDRPTLLHPSGFEQAGRVVVHILNTCTMHVR